MEPVTTVTTAWTIAKTAGEISKKLYELGKSIKDREAKQHVDEILDQLRELKHLASQLEDENRDLREKLRFKSSDYEFHSPFWFEKAHQTNHFAQSALRKRSAHQWGSRVKDVTAVIACVWFAAKSWKWVIADHSNQDNHIIKLA